MLLTHEWRTVLSRLRLIRSEKDNDNLYCSTAPDHKRTNDLRLIVTREMRKNCDVFASIPPRRARYTGKTLGRVGIRL